MLLEQELSIRKVERGITVLSDILVREFGLEEDDALEIVRELPDLVDRVQDGDMKGLLAEAVRRAPKPRRVVISGDDPDELYPGHPQHMPRITTKTTFNEHVAQAMAPYIKAIMNKVAKDRGLEPPNEKTVEAVLEKTDWARAAYEAKKVNKRSPSAVKNFVVKYFFRPLDKLSGFGVSMVALMSMYMSIRIAFALFGQLEALGKMLDAAGAESTFAKNVRGRSQWAQKRAQNRFFRKQGIPRKARQFKVY